MCSTNKRNSCYLLINQNHLEVAKMRKHQNKRKKNQSYLRKNRILTDCKRDFGRKSSTSSSLLASTNSLSSSFSLMLLLGLINNRDRAGLLHSNLFTGGESTKLSDESLLGVLISGVAAISLIGVETSLAGVASEVLACFLAGVASKASAHLLAVASIALVHFFGGSDGNEGLSKDLFCMQIGAF